ncbi:hypothetical protein PQX77_019620 [Marasmius sp. AFHP31]|nr:hypothetical protein PQX77_019620 [Marasmius sp. AFHP31]
MARVTPSVITTSSVTIEGLDIEDAQQHIMAMLQVKNLIELKETSIQKKQTALLQWVHKFYRTLCQHMPGVQQLIDTETLLTMAVKPEEMKLFLPAQLQARTVTYKKSSHVGTSQSMYLMNHMLQDQIEAKMKALSETYCQACASLIVLHGKGDWCRTLCKLKLEDIRGISEQLLQSKEKEQFQKNWEHARLSADDMNSLVSGLNIPTIVVNPMLSLGQSKNHLSWIWFTHWSVVKGSDRSTPSTGGQFQGDTRE